MIGLVGPQRVGKSTLADAFAKRHNIPFVQTSATEVFKRMGFDPKAEYPLDVRLMIQEAILGVFELQYKEAAAKSPLFIADRTPIDMASYTLSEVSRTTLVGEPEMAQLLNDYVDRCLKSAARHFAMIVLVQPGIPLVEAEGKAPAEPAYMEHLVALQRGLLADDRCPVRRFSIPRATLDLEKRIDSLDKAFVSCVEANEAIKAARVLH